MWIEKKTPRLDTELQVPNVVFIYGLYNVLLVSNNSGTKGSRVISLSTVLFDFPTFYIIVYADTTANIFKVVYIFLGQVSKIS